MTQNTKENTRTGLEIAVIGMAGRFPGAGDIDEYWENLKKGIETVTHFTDEELIEAGVEPETLKNPAYIKVRGVLPEAGYFDASFFEYLPAEARVMDPQARVFHECVWQAMEDAGYDSGTYPGVIGLYGGAASGLDWQALTMLSGAGDTLDYFSLMQLRDKDFMTTHISYKLNLKGPSFTMYTACSTSLVAVNLACQGILSGECDMALAGGAKIFLPQKRGYMYREGMIGSPDGRCRAFDSKAKGTIFGSGVGAVMLKLLSQAEEDRDHIYAVVKGSAINNDGSRKAGFSAPSIDGQAEVIKAALLMADVEPETIDYIETHGTGTSLGDPVEFAALKLAFDSEKRRYCGIGSVKTNIGHLDSAAGIAGFIKTVLILSRRSIPPSLHFENPNPQLDIENSPFYVVTEPTAMKSGVLTPGPLRAGVNAFGIGGTNAHMILEEAPPRNSSNADKGDQAAGSGGPAPSSGEKSSAPPYTVMLSAKSKTSLTRMTENLRVYLEKHPGIDFADVVYTLQVGRRAFKQRRMFLCSGAAEAVRVLAAQDPEKIKTYMVKGDRKPVIFMFSGQGSQYINMGLGLYNRQPLFRREMDRCFDIMKESGLDLKAVLYPPQQEQSSAVPASDPDTSDKPDKSNSSVSSVPSVANSDPINNTEITQPLIFVIEYALAKLLLHWGIEPKAMIGHSIGEYAAAHLAGVFSLEDALALVVQRGRLMQQMPPGSMLSVPVSEERLLSLLEGKGDISPAALNSSERCVVSGPHEAIDAFEKELADKGYKTRRLHTSHAFHSQMMEPILAEFEDKVKAIKLNKPQIPYISNVSGHWIKAGEAQDPAYWSKQIRSAVRFNRGLQELLSEDNTLLVEVGPGKALCTFVRQHKDKKPSQQVINLVRHPQEDIPDNAYLLDRLGQIWLYGAKIDWAAFYSQEKRCRVPLPTYPFDRQKYWIEGDPFKIGVEMMAGTARLRKKADMGDWFYVPSWERSAIKGNRSVEGGKSLCWLLFIADYGPGSRLKECLLLQRQDVVIVRAGTAFKRVSAGEYVLDPAEPADYDSLFRELINTGKVPDCIVHLWNVTGAESQGANLETIDGIQDTGLFSLLEIARAIGSRGITNNIKMAVVSDGLHEVMGDEILHPGKAALLGAVKVIPLEYPTIQCKNIDIPAAASMHGNSRVELLLQELHSDFSHRVTAIRGSYSWAPTVKPVRLDGVEGVGRRFREGGVYLITGGLGGIGFTLAEYLARAVKARLILVGSSPFPSRAEWSSRLESHGEKDKVNLKIKKIKEWENLGAEVMIVRADVSNLEQMQDVFSRAKERFGPVNGILHTAGVGDYHGVIQRRNRRMTESVLAPKVKGTLVFDKILTELDAAPDFFVLFSSLGNNLYIENFGQVGYNAANEFLEAYACYRAGKNGVYTLAINWCGWKEVGMAAAAIERRASQGNRSQNSENRFSGAVTPLEGVEIFKRLMEKDLSRVAVSTRDLNALFEHLLREKSREAGVDEDAAEESLSSSYEMLQRPELGSEYAAPGNKTEQTLAKTWQNFFGINRVGIHDDFFELGGDSLKVMTVASHIHKALNIDIPLQVFFSRPTIKKLAEYILENSGEDVYISIKPAEEKEYYLLSSAQKRIYIAHQLEKDSIVYNQPTLKKLILETDFDKEKIEKTFRKLIRRHDSLRTYVELLDKEPVQKILHSREIEFNVEYYDTGNERTLQDIINDFVRPFDLGRAPLFRAVLIKIADKEYILMADFHHIISDGLSHQVFVSEFIRLYGGESLPALRLQYKDYSGWQNFLIRSGEIKKQEEYWLKEFSGGLSQLDLPADYERPEVQDFAGDMTRFDIDGEALEKLRAYVKSSGATMFIVVFTIFNVFLYKLTGREDIIIGTVAMGRRHTDLESIIGMFVNTLVLRNYPGGEKTFAGFLKEVRERTLQAFDNQDYQFEDLVDKMQVKRDAGRNPIFDVMYTHRSEKVEAPPGDAAGTAEEEQPGIENENYGYKGTQSKFDLILTSIERTECLILALTYSTALFKRATIERFIKYFKEVLAAITGDEDIKLKDIEISHDLGEVKSDIYQGIESDFEF